MPHATETVQAVTNGDKPQSKFISHVTSYPVVNDTINEFKSNPYGKRSLEVADTAYQRLGKPVEPYLETPYSYAKPYVTKADELADSGLDTIDSHFPIVKEDTATIIDTGKGYLLFPFKLANDSKQYVLKTWDDQYKKTSAYKSRGPGLYTSILAIISTEFQIAADAIHYVGDYVGPKYEEGKQSGSDLLHQVSDLTNQYKNYGSEKLSELQKQGQAKVDELQKVGNQKVEQAKQTGSQKAEEVKQVGSKKVDQAKQEAQKAQSEVGVAA